MAKEEQKETMEQTVQRWFSDEDTWVGVFENHDLGHPDVGRRFALPFRRSDGSFSAAKVSETRAPDTRMGFGWRYLLVAKCESWQSVIEEMGKERK